MFSSPTSWEKWTVPELKSQLKELKLPVSGKKSELIQRLTKFADSSKADSSTKQVENTEMNNKKSVKATQNEVSDTIRMLEGLKLNDLSSSNLQSLSTLQKEKLKSLRESLDISDESPEQNKEQHEDLSPKQHARRELLEHHRIQLRMRPANDLKEKLTSLRLKNKGRKPDLVDRLAEYYVAQELGDIAIQEQETMIPIQLPNTAQLSKDAVISFAGLPRLSTAAANALTQAFGYGSGKPPEPTPIQRAAISKLFYPPQPSAILHAPTGSGKTLTYLLPITESLWREVNENQVDPNELENGIALILLPTRELAAQVAGVATVLAPKGMVRFVSQPMDLMKKGQIDAGADFTYYEEHGYDDDSDRQASGPSFSPRILIGSAKSISISCFGDGKMPGTPTRKPDGKRLLSSVRWLVMDEVGKIYKFQRPPLYSIVSLHLITSSFIIFRSPPKH